MTDISVSHGSNSEKNKYMNISAFFSVNSM